jgi:NTP pyrophosphatase (non-canonical NTP hydrolase)
MFLNTYQKAAIKTIRYPNPGSNFNYPLLGLIGELGETLRAHIDREPTEKLKDEAGDILWYIALMAMEMGIKMADVLHPIDIYVDTMEAATGACYAIFEPSKSSTTDLLAAVVNGTELANIYKKVQRDDEGVITPARMEKLKMNLAMCLAHTIRYINAMSLILEDVANYNIEKLSK